MRLYLLSCKGEICNIDPLTISQSGLLFFQSRNSMPQNVSYFRNRSALRYSTRWGWAFNLVTSEMFPLALIPRQISAECRRESVRWKKLKRSLRGESEERPLTPSFKLRRHSHPPTHPTTHPLTDHLTSRQRFRSKCVRASGTKMLSR